MFTINYSRNGVAVGDNDLMEFIKNSYEEQPNGSIDVSISIAILAVRVWVVRGLIPYDQVIICVEGEEVSRLSPHAKFLGRYPKSLCLLDDLLDEMIFQDRNTFPTLRTRAKRN